MHGHVIGKFCLNRDGEQFLKYQLNVHQSPTLISRHQNRLVMIKERKKNPMLIVIQNVRHGYVLV